MTAPIALFVYKRPEHTQRTILALRAAQGFEDAHLYVFGDGPKTAGDAAAVLKTRQIVSAFNLPNATIQFKDENVGLARSVIAGVTALCSHHGKVIVLEDDLIIAPAFLRYMNQALERYEAEPTVMQVSGHMFPVAVRPPADAFFMPFITSWGWATWQRAWSHFDSSLKGCEKLSRSAALRRRFDLDGSYPYHRILNKQLRRRIDSWAIQWYWAVFARGGLALYPSRSLVGNVGLDGTGTHGHGARTNERVEFDEAPREFSLPRVEVDETAFRAVKRFLKSESSMATKLLARATRLFTSASDRGR